MTFDLMTALVFSGGCVAGVLVYRWTAPPQDATTPSKGERLLFALTAAVAVITIGGFLGGGFRGIERTEKARAAEAVESGTGR
ncbi:hypothetical protein [Streptomyces sp. NPDC088757]|uniref:hypothetical protein n=1 Tax=Streptomyces sp. NPDC088757 TaxID=3365889 RepID=UPI0037F49BA9